MAFSKSPQHVVEMTVIDVELVLEVLLEFIYHHISWSLLHLLEDFIHIVMML